MSIFKNAALLTGLVALMGVPGCGEDDKAAGGKQGATGGDASTGGQGNGNTGGTDQGGNTSTAECNIYDPARPVTDIPTDGQGNLSPGSGAEFTLTHDKTWRLNGTVYVPAGLTLTIEPCTLVVGTPKPNAGSLFITRGAKIQADGTSEKPIVFSSEDFKFHPNAPWGGVVLLGKAPIGASDPAQTNPERVFEGLTDTRAAYGGSDPEDNSGSLSYVRIEYGGDIIVADKEINGLTLGGIGRGTMLHHIMVKRQMDDCFEWFGGTVDADHLICENPGDDMFDTDEKFKGHLQFLFGRLTTQGSSADPNGFEWDGNQPNFATVTDRGTPQAANATLCGLNMQGTAASNGAVLRRGLLAGTTIVNTIITGFDNGVDTRDTVGTNAAPLISWTHSLFFGQTTNNIAAATESKDNDSGFDELAWLSETANANATDKPAGFDCYANPPHPVPDAAVSGGTPAAPFKTDSTYVGAFRDKDDNWMTGAWVDWASGD